MADNVIKYIYIGVFAFIGNTLTKIHVFVSSAVI
jgi:hypothetical protein